MDGGVPLWWAFGFLLGPAAVAWVLVLVASLASPALRRGWPRAIAWAILFVALVGLAVVGLAWQDG
jgi:hypothetical protein